jgi:hypothetical protein
LKKQNKSNKDGTLSSPDVYSWQTIGGIARPYVLASSISLAGYGLIERNVPAFFYGLSALPYALSLYVRDSNSGGLIDKITNNIKNLFKAPAPAGA